MPPTTFISSRWDGTFITPHDRSPQYSVRLTKRRETCANAPVISEWQVCLLNQICSNGAELFTLEVVRGLDLIPESKHVRV
jgi:hypothetical protein